MLLDSGVGPEQLVSIIIADRTAVVGSQTQEPFGECIVRAS